MREFTIGKNDAGQRADRFVAKTIPGLSSAQIQKYFRLKRFKLNGKRCDPALRLCQGDVMCLYINDVFFETASRLPHPVKGELTILYEDTNILLADKPEGLVVHEDDHGSRDTLIGRIQSYLYEKGEWDPALEHAFTPALCNRIDRNTGGIVIAAKNAEALRILNEKIKARELRKFYLCLVHGKPSPESGILENILVKDTADNYMRVSRAPVRGGLFCRTAYHVLRSGSRLSLVECELLTGRTHQIRAQFAHAGYPLAGDGKYGSNRKNQGLPFRHQALYSYKISFDFRSDAGCLQYLCGRDFSVDRVWFDDERYLSL